MRYLTFLNRLVLYAHSVYINKMILNYTDSYEPWIEAGYKAIGNIQLYITQHAPFVGDSQALDNAFAQSIMIEALIDHFKYVNNNDRALNETLLMCLKSMIKKDICKPAGNSVKKLK